MPVTARLSQLFYERLGEQIANELVDWFNQVDATYRSDLRELNELNFARFDARLEQRVAQLEAKIDQRVAQLEAKIEQGLAQLEARFEQRVSALRAELMAEIQVRFAAVGGRFDALEARLIGRLDARMSSVQVAMLRWMLAGWATIVLLLLGSLLAVLRTR